MARKIKITDYKTERINKYTGGQIRTYTINDIPDGILKHSFVTLDGKQYIGDYAHAWWYFRNNMLVCFKYPHGVAIVLKHPAKDYKYLADYMTDGRVGGDDIKGYYGYTHRGGQIFGIGDMLFDVKYRPIEENFTKKQWQEFTNSQDKTIKEGVEKGWYDNYEKGLIESPVSDFVPFKLRGFKKIENWDEAYKAAKNMSEYLS